LIDREGTLREHVADLLAEVPRAGVEHEEHPILVVTLDLEEVVAAAERPDRQQGAVQPTWRNRCRCLHPDQLEHSIHAHRRTAMHGETGRDVALDLAEHRPQLFRRQRVFPDEVGPGNLHATADVDADGIRHHRVRSEENAADRHSEPDVRVGHEGCVVDGDLEIAEIACLAQGVGFDLDRPGVDRQSSTRDDLHVRRPLGHQISIDANG
jgi:hypothetical protein